MYEKKHKELCSGVHCSSGIPDSSKDGYGSYRKRYSREYDTEYGCLRASLLKKGLSENSSNDIVGVINQHNGCSLTVAVQEYGCLRGGI
ncbi:hypothetical protein [Methanosarcina barkeri]|uniref:hypothetical protein n=1 Tax=Methanosarcina barkeri TaxID=2208 RepID=UPI001FB1FE25|nr:hypothetical protein [Methanosarcina barkeri]